MTTATAAPLAMRLLPPEDAYDYEFYRARLADPAVLADAVALCIFRVPLLAIPVGGPRRGGYTCFDSEARAMEARALLDGRAGFPDLRVQPTSRRESRVVEWGDKPPVGDYAARGRFYGYSHTAIAAFLRDRIPMTPSSAFTASSFTAP